MKSGMTLFKYLGIELSVRGAESIGDCPFCGGTKKLYVNNQKTTFHCKKCDQRGNSSSLLGIYFDRACNLVPLRERKILAKDRRLPSKAFKCEQLKWDPFKERLVFCVRDFKGSIIALRYPTPRRLDRKTGKYKRRFMNLKSCPNGLLGLEDYEEGRSIYIVEGEWDWFAMRYLLGEMGVDGCVLAVPGAGNFKEEWGLGLRDTHAYIYFDNDEPGKNGAARTAKILRNYCETRVFNWDVTYPDGYDINDFISENSGALKEVYEELSSEEHLSAYAPTEENAEGMTEEAAQQEKLDPMSVEEMHRTFHRWLKMDNCDMIDILMGTLWSIHYPGNPLWLFVVAPSSGSKSETLMPLAAWHRCHDLSTMKPKSLVSGFIAKGEDPSLFGRINGKKATVIVKDLTPLLENPYDMSEVFAILRDAYDGKYRQEYGNGTVRIYDQLHFGMICGVTYAIDEYNSVAMGERFLKFRSDKEIARSNDSDVVIQAVMNSSTNTEMQKELREACVRCLARKLDPHDSPVPDMKFARAISGIANFCAAARAVAPSDKFTGVQRTTPTKEVPARIGVQLTKLARGLATHYEASDLNDSRILRLIRRVAIHTPDIITVRIIRALYDQYHQDGGSSIKGVAQTHRNLTIDTVRETVKKLFLTGVVEQIETVEGSKQYRLTEEMFGIIRDNQLFESLPKNDPIFRGRRFVLRGKK